jgi:hypothetical protein
MTPLEQVQQAYLHLCWAIKFDSYLRLHPPAHKVNFDNPQSITDPADTCWLPGEQFDTIDDILLGAENSILLSVGTLFLALDTAINEGGLSMGTSDQDALGQLCILIYMCRCAFAHNVLAPRWEVRGKYCRQLEIMLPNISLHIDLNQLAGMPFDINQIGGYDQLFKIVEYIIQNLRKEE